MPWNNQSGGKGGGPWGGGEGGPWGGGGTGPNRPNPWGQGPQRGPDPQNSPDLEELLRRSQDKLKRVFPGGGGNRGGGGRTSMGGLGRRGIILALIAIMVVYGLTGFYRVGPGELGVELVLGRYQSTTQPGLNYNWPYPFGEVYTPDVLRIREVNIGTRGEARGGQDIPEESLMLTGDENIVDVNFRVQWRISDPANYLFNIEDPEDTVKQVAESAMREVVGRKNIQPILTQERQQIEQDVQTLMQQTLDEYGAGVMVSQVQMQKVDPPSQVIDAFRARFDVTIELAETAQENENFLVNRELRDVELTVADMAFVNGTD